MAAGHQVKKLRKQLSLSQNRAIREAMFANIKDYDDRDDHGSRPIEIIPKHWGAYVLMFCSVAIVVICFVLFDSVSAALLPRNSAIGLQQRLGSLGVQVGDHDPNFFRPFHKFEAGALVVGVSKSSNMDQSLLKGKLMSDILKGKELWSALPTQQHDKESERLSKPGTVRQSRKEGILKPSSAEYRQKKEELAQGRDLAGIEEAEEESKNKGEQIFHNDVGKKQDGKKDSTTPVAEETPKTRAEGTKQESTANDKELKSNGISVVNDVNNKVVEGSTSKKGGKGEDVAKPTSVDDPPRMKQEKILIKSSTTGTPCDYSMGKWVHDENYPLYPSSTCPYIDPGFRCVENGRPNLDFQKWRWQPAECRIPRFNPEKMLRRMRGLRMAFVGDSLGRNSWESMMCMLAEAVPDRSRLYPLKGHNITKYVGSVTFRFEDYNFSLEYYRSTHLVLHSDPPPGSDPKVKSTLKVDRIDNTSTTWRDADIVIFNTGHWWTPGKTVESGVYFQRGKIIEKDMDAKLAFRLAMKTVARFVEKNMNADKTQVFFMSYTPHHFKGGKWNEGGTCNDDTKPIKKFPFVYEDKSCNNMILEALDTNVKHPINFLNITYISDLRPDGHNSIWRTVPPLPMEIQDCSHWCLPGVPETWNEILFASLLDIGKGGWGAGEPARLEASS